MSTQIVGEDGRPPAWWNPHGFKMDLKEIDQRRNPLGIFTYIATNVAEVEIQAGIPRLGNFLVSWKLQHVSGNVEGLVRMSAHICASAFGLTDFIPPGSEPFVAKYEGTAGAQGRFLRRGNFLNIPGPGTGDDGDPNISIYLAPEIKAAIQKDGKLHRS